MKGAQLDAELDKVNCLERAISIDLQRASLSYACGCCFTKTKISKPLQARASEGESVECVCVFQMSEWQEESNGGWSGERAQKGGSFMGALAWPPKRRHKTYSLRRQLGSHGGACLLIIATLSLVIVSAKSRTSSYVLVWSH